MKTQDDPIIWTGDLDDDCTATWNGLGAHAEAMDEDSWYCSVWLESAATGDRDLLHSTSDDIHPLTGVAARALCEQYMRAHYYARRAAELEEAVRGQEGLTDECCGRNCGMADPG